MREQRRTHVKAFVAGIVAAMAAPVVWGQSMPQAVTIVWPTHQHSAALTSVRSALALPSSIALMNGVESRARAVQGELLNLKYGATRCPVCVRQEPHLWELYTKHRGQVLVVLRSSVDQESTGAAAYIGKHGMNFPVAGLSARRFRALPKSASLPVTIAIGLDGHVKKAEAGEMFPEDVSGVTKFL